MTNNEILRSDMLDILFEHRNKAYGAYALRRGYDQRLIVALGLGLSLILLFLLIKSLSGGNDQEIRGGRPIKDSVMITQIELPKVEKPEEEKPVKKSIVDNKPVEKFNTVKFTVPVIVPDEVKTPDEIPEAGKLKENEIGGENSKGKEPTGVVPVTAVPGNGNDNNKDNDEKPLPAFIPEERDPEFPGGPEALYRFLSRNLDTPDDLGPGDKKTVRIRFWVGNDGSISVLEIEQSGGDIFDKEVVRVCKKMPRWKPAIQNGTAVPVSYLLPVTFIGSEQ